MFQKPGIENTHKAVFEGEGLWDVPKIRGANFDVRTWQKETGGVVIGFNYCKTYLANDLDPKETGVHFFLDDYQFERLWRRPDDYTDLLIKFKFVLSPDFSLYTDHPKAVQLFNHYKKHWLAAYWESIGIPVVPTVCWSTADSFSWCFDGEPKNGIAAVSTKGTQRSEETKERFRAGYCAMLKRTEPEQILLFGNDCGALDGNVIYMGYEFQDAFAKRAGGR